MPIMKLTDLHVTPLLQVRATGLNAEAIEDYGAAARRGDLFPPLVAFVLTDRKFPKPALVAGFHRHQAFTRAGLTECEVEVRTGTFADAWLFAWGSNLKNAVRYTNSDKRKASETALRLYRADSAAVIAERIGVSDEYVRKVRKELVAAGALDGGEKVKGKDGAVSPSRIKKKSDDAGSSPTVGEDSNKAKNDAAVAVTVSKPHAPSPAAHAIACLEQLPADEAVRLRAFEDVVEWISRAMPDHPTLSAVERLAGWLRGPKGLGEPCALER